MIVAFVLQSFNALKDHLSQFHSDAGRSAGKVDAHVYIYCRMCILKHPFSEVTLFGQDPWM